MTPLLTAVKTVGIGVCVSRPKRYIEWKSRLVFQLHRLRTSKPLSLLEKMIAALTS